MEKKFVNNTGVKFTKFFVLSNGKAFATDGKRYYTSSNSTGEMFQTSRANYSLGLNAYKAECNGQKLGC